jgi:hypothetical protein
MKFLGLLHFRFRCTSPELTEWRSEEFQQSEQGHYPKYCYDKNDPDERTLECLVMEDAAASDDPEHPTHRRQSEEDSFRNPPGVVLGLGLVDTHQDEPDETGDD